MTPNTEQLSDKISAADIAYLFPDFWEVLRGISVTVVKVAYWGRKYHPRIVHLCAMSKKARVRKKNARRLWRLYLTEAKP